MSGALNGLAIVIAVGLYAASVVHVMRQEDEPFDGAGVGPRRWWLVTLLVLGPLWSVAYFVYAVRRAAHPRPLPTGWKRWRVGLTLSFVAYLSGMGFLGVLMTGLSYVLGGTDVPLTLAYLLAGLGSGLVALWHGPRLPLVRGRLLLAIAAPATYLVWGVVTVQMPTGLPPSWETSIYMGVARLLAPGVIGAVLAVLLWRRSVQSHVSPAYPAGVPDGG